MKRLGLVFRNLNRAKKLVLAAEWLFNSYEGHDELLGYVQTMVVLEILLGEKARSDLMGLGELLRNRCAYLIGRTHSEREEILQTFGKIYDVRSHIVHAGKRRLNTEERRLFFTLQRYCHLVLRAEFELLERDPVTQTGDAEPARRRRQLARRKRS